MTAAMPQPRSLLFVPGNRPERFDKAAESGADFVCIDLEDAVAPDAKAEARDAVVAYLNDTAHTHVGVRINSPGTQYIDADQDALEALDMPFVMVPKVDTATELEAIRLSAPLIPVLESALAILNARDIMASERVTMALFGGGDFTADMGIPMTWDAMHHARAHLATCAVAYDVHLFDVPYIDVHDVAGGERDTERVAALGIPARAALHPKQIPAIHRALDPSEEEIADAHEIVAAYEASGGNVALHRGKLIEAPTLRAAQRVLARAGQSKGIV